MKTITLTIVCSLIMIFANAQETKTYYDNGQLKEIGSLEKNGKNMVFIGIYMKKEIQNLDFTMRENNMVNGNIILMRIN